MKNSFDECSSSPRLSYIHPHNSPPSKKIKRTNEVQKLLFKIGVFQDGRYTVAGVDKLVEAHSQTPKKMKIRKNSITFKEKQKRSSKQKMQIKFYQIRFCTQNTIWFFIYDFVVFSCFYFRFLIIIFGPTIHTLCFVGILDFDFVDFWFVIFKRTPFLVSLTLLLFLWLFVFYCIVCLVLVNDDCFCWIRRSNNDRYN